MDPIVKRIIFSLLIAAAIIGAIVCACEAVGTVENGTYVIKQSVSGQLQAYMKPGIYSKNFGTVTTWPIAETFYFTKEDAGSKDDARSYGAIEVRFNDGGVCQISGTCRIDLPRSEDEAITLVTKFGYRDHDQIEQKLILPTIRRAVIMTANLMSSKDSYSDRRADFFNYSWDQIANGIYQTKDNTVTEPDPITGVAVTRVRKDILRDSAGTIMREQNPLEGTGITLSIFEIKDFNYEDKVKAQISTQQDAIMAVQTARANAQKAVQDALTAEADGKAAVMKAQYEELEKKARADVAAQQVASVAIIDAQKVVDVAAKTKETALIAAEQERAVAETNLATAKLTAQNTVAIATANADARKMILASDGALAAKLDAMIQIHKVWAEALARRQVPAIIMGQPSGSEHGTDAQTFMELLQIKAAKDLALDMHLDTNQQPATR